ncbi:hypothetical protein QE429_000962 [Bacillus sp. SORGH_AS 510]|uniref:zinc ribbon domain-containing protein n=1 Tax=Bacillus sp. SORGH_AS_0510 TaxID=3041771 RepID=UPI00277D96F3|nr:zinc ribbon domain-containing protein [Bacillus sp. SORGH_AS_0510]MDQ1144135.1 hypothetical protein [Bacillus sp. SORGH_AS_0510]
MSKLLLRRLSAGIILLSFLLPWYEDFLTDYSGLAIITEGFNDGSEEGTFVAVLAIVTAILTLLVAVFPKLILTILALVPSAFWLFMFYGSEDISEYRMYGAVVFTIGVIGIFLSFFIKNQNNVTNGTTDVRQEIASTHGDYNSAELNQTSENLKQYCKHCGQEVSVTSKFCPSCGSSR